MARRRKEQASPDVELVAFAAEESATVEAEVFAESAKEQESAPASIESIIVAEYHEEMPFKQPTKWVVLEDQVVSLFGQMTTLPAGTIVSASSYGPLGVKRIMEQGVILEPVG